MAVSGTEREKSVVVDAERQSTIMLFVTHASSSTTRSRYKCSHREQTTPGRLSNRRSAVEKLVIDTNAGRTSQNFRFVWIRLEPIGPHPDISCFNALGDLRVNMSAADGRH